MNTNNSKNTDHHDRLLDTALREVVGQETPPDLSNKILAAAGETSQPLATLGDDAMTTQQQQTRRKRNFYIGAVLAASLLVVGSLMFPELESTKQLGRRVQPENKSMPVSNQLPSQDEGLEPNVLRGVKIKEFTVPPAISPDAQVWSDLTNRRERYAKVDLQKKSPAEESKNLKMMVTPHIIIQEGEEERLGLSDGTVGTPLKVKVHPVADIVLPVPASRKQPGQKELQGLVNDAHAAPAFAPATTSVPQQHSSVKTHHFYSGRRSGHDAKTKSQAWGYGGRGGYGGEMGGYGGRDDSIRLGYAWKPRNSHRTWGATMGRQKKIEQGQGPDASGDQYIRIYENPFIAAEGEQAVSTFSIDVDTASYANVRQFLLQSGQLPPPDAVRIEELVNYFSYDYTAPTDDTPFAAHVEVAGCPWNAEHRLVRVGIKGHEIANEKRPQSNLVFLIDVSGSMNEPAKLPLLVEGLKMLTRELGENDRVAIVVYASSEGLALPSTRGDQQDTILDALEKLRAGGSTAGGAGIQLAYKIAQENLIEGGVNRVILATDGDFNVGTTSTGDLQRLAESNAQETGVFLTVLGFGRGNLNDAMMETISGKGNGNYHYVDNRAEARKVLVEEISGTLVTIAKDVKIQIEFNPAQVAAYRLIGYENRMLETQDFNDDKKDAGEIGAGHTVTAIYEVVPAGIKVETPKVDPLKYQPRAEAAETTEKAKTASDADASGELLTLKLRYKQPDGDKSTKLEFPITDNGQAFTEATDDFKFASAVASFGMLLRHSEHSGNASYAAVSEIAEESLGKDLHGYRAEFLQLVRQAKTLAGE